VRLNFKDFAQKLPLIKQNVINRKATGYANPDLVNHLYEEYRRMKFEIDQLRKKRNDHSQTLKNVLLIEEDDKREKLIEQHHKVGKSFKTDLQNREKEFEQIEAQLIVIL
jgi:seryl-tRNA synthetase